MENKLLETQIKYHEEKEKKNEIIAELNRITDDLKDALKLENYYREELDKHTNFIKAGFTIEEDGTLSVLVEEYHYANEEIKEDTQYPEVRERVEWLRHLYEEKEQGKFYTNLTRCDIKNMVKKENDYISN